MRTVRRLYFYAVALISLQITIWGSVNLMRTIFSGRTLIGEASLLATGLSLVLVGVPVFFIHWSWAQREARRDEEEQTSRIRAIFHYSALMSVLIPVVYAVLAITNRGVMTLLGISARSALFGGNQTNLDNLIAIVVNLVALIYLSLILQRDWFSAPAGHFLAETRRLYRYLWVLIGLILLVGGCVGLLRYLFTFGFEPQQISAVSLGNGLALALVGIALWTSWWLVVQRSLNDNSERLSLLRLGVLYLITLSAVVVVLTNSGLALAAVMRWALGAATTWASFMSENGASFALAIVLGVVWAYHGGMLTREMAALPDQPRRAALRRLYYSLLSLMGLATTFSGILVVLFFLVEVVFGAVIIGNLRDAISAGVALLVVGVPLWLRTWHHLQAEASERTAAGDRARQSVLRKVYLYLVLFAAVVGGMVTAGQWLYSIFNALLQNPEPDFWRNFFLQLRVVATILVFLVYHLQVQRSDGRLAQQALLEQHGRFPVLVAASGPEQDFARLLQVELQRQAPGIPLTVVELSEIRSASPAAAVVLPSRLLVNLPPELRDWLEAFSGERLVVPLDQPGWTWLGQGKRPLSELAKETARALRQLAEGETVRPGLSTSPWMVVGYILAALFGLQLLFVLFALVMSVMGR